MPSILLFDSVVEDSQQIKAALELHNHQVTLCESSHMALEFSTAFQYDAIIYTIDNIVSDRPKILEDLRHNHSKKDTPIMLILGQSERHMLQKVFSFSADAVFIKPFSPVVFVERLDSLIQARKSMHSSMDTQIILIFLNAASKAFHDLASVTLKAGKPYRRVKEESVNDVSAILTFSSEVIQGTIAINLSREFLKIVHNRMLPHITEVIDDNLKDVAGELSNQILGRAKSRFIQELGISFNMKVPEVITGAAHLLNYQRKEMPLIIPFQWTGHQVLLEFVLDIPDPATIEEIKRHDKEAETGSLNEGDVLIF